jgi:hypothetical protein
LGVSPFWVTFSPPTPIAEIREKLVRYRAATPQRCFDYLNGSVNVPIFLITGVEKRYIIDDAVRQIRELVAELRVRESEVVLDTMQTLDLNSGPEHDLEDGANE